MSKSEKCKQARQRWLVVIAYREILIMLEIFLLGEYLVAYTLRPKPDICDGYEVNRNCWDFSFSHIFIANSTPGVFFDTKQYYLLDLAKHSCYFSIQLSSYSFENRMKRRKCYIYLCPKSILILLSVSTVFIIFWTRIYLRSKTKHSDNMQTRYA